MQRIIERLLERNHEVTAITNFKMEFPKDLPKPKNYTEILISPPYVPNMSNYYV